MNIKIRSWQTKDGKTRTIRLHRAWTGLKQRCKGNAHDGKGNTIWKGLTWGWNNNWLEFRQWALDNGYNKERCSLDRIDSTLGYSPDNCQWITKADNCRKAVRKREAKK